MGETPFNQEKALERYTELMRLVVAGDGGEKDVNELEYQAALRGLHFVKILKRYIAEEQRYELQPMSSEQIAAFTGTLTNEIEGLREMVLSLQSHGAALPIQPLASDLPDWLLKPITDDYISQDCALTLIERALKELDGEYEATPAQVQAWLIAHHVDLPIGQISGNLQIVRNTLDGEWE